jgi:ribosome-associated translation inhibitor RaiA
MQVQINTDHHVEGHEALAAWATSEVKAALKHHSAHIMRLEAHLGDENGQKSGLNDKRCVLEARLVGRPSLAVTEHAATLYQAVTGAADKLNRLIDSTLGRAERLQAVPE